MRIDSMGPKYLNWMRNTAWSVFVVAAMACPAQTSTNTKWVRSQFTDSTTGDVVTTYRLDANPDPSGARKPYLLIACDPRRKQYSDSYYTDMPVSVDPSHPASDGEFMAVNLQFSGETTKPKTERKDTERDFKTIDLDRSVMQVVATQNQLILRFPSASGAMITDTFDTQNFPAQQYASDCLPPPRLLRRSSQ